MNREKSVIIVEYHQHQKNYKRLSFRREMANVKYNSYFFWTIFGVFILALWIGLYVGFVVPIENSVLFHQTQCTTVHSTPGYSVHCPCKASSCPESKSYPCVQIYVNYTLTHGGASKYGVKYSQLHFSEAVLGYNVSLFGNILSSRNPIDNGRAP